MILQPPFETSAKLATTHARTTTPHHTKRIECSAASFLSSQVWWLLVVVLLDVYNSYGGLTWGSIYEEA